MLYVGWGWNIEMRIIEEKVFVVFILFVFVVFFCWIVCELFYDYLFYGKSKGNKVVVFKWDFKWFFFINYKVYIVL